MSIKDQKGERDRKWGSKALSAEIPTPKKKIPFYLDVCSRVALPATYSAKRGLFLLDFFSCLLVIFRGRE